MSLITRCPRCSTMFNVVTDQLKVSSGWVRCGHCAEVFDATAHMQQAPSPMPAFAQVDQVGIPSLMHEAQSADPVPESVGPEQNQDQDEDRDRDRDSEQDAAREAQADVPSPALILREPEVPSSPGASVADLQNISMPSLEASAIPLQSGLDDDGGHSDFDPIAWRRKTMGLHAQDDAESADTILAGDYDGLQGSGQHTKSEAIKDKGVGEADSEWPLDHAGDALDSEGFSFVRDARRRAFWRRPAVRLATGASAFLLAVLLVFQVGLQQRDTLMSMGPRLKTGLQALCASLGCELAPLKQIESIIIDSSAFSKLAPDTYRLSFVLKNTGALTVAMPALEVTLTDTQDQALVRRVVLPALLGASNPTLPAGESFSGAIALQLSPGTGSGAGISTSPAGPLRVAGYRVLAFYP